MTGGEIQLTVDTSKVTAAMRRFPATVYERTRSFVFRAFLDHRDAWLRQKGPRFGRGGRGIKVHRVGEGPAVLGPKDVTYEISGPRRVSSDKEGAEQLAKFSARIGTGNLVLKIHQEGTDIASAGYMALPLRTRPGDPAAWRARYPDRKLVARPIRGGKLLLFEVKALGKRKRAAEERRYQWIPRFLLTRRVDMRPTLRFYETWTELERERAAKWDEAVRRMDAEGKER